MKKIIVCTGLFLITTLSAHEWGYPVMPIADIKPGMTGTGRTVFYGDEIEEFGVEVIDVMRNYYPRLDVILVRLSGETAAKTGIVSGMSGSPVYIDGKLVGALAYGFGQFMKEPIAGIMPIESMFQIADKEKVRETPVSRHSSQLQDYLDAVLVGADDVFWKKVLHMPDDVKRSPSNLAMISSPLIFSGFQSELVNLYASYFESQGFTPVVAGGRNAAEAERQFQPGSAVSVVFVTGDLSIEATGTVTAVGNNKILAFGHQLFNFGPISLPLAAAKIYATLPSMMQSSKVATALEVVGTFLQDRLSGALGDLTVQPRMIPVHLQAESPFHANTEFNFKVANDPAFNNLLPFYMRTALIQAAYSARLAGEQNTSHLTGAIYLSDGRAILLDDLFASRQTFGFLASGADAVSATDLVTTILGTVMIHDFNGPEVSSVDIKLKTIPGRKYAFIESVWQDKTKVKPGDNVTLVIQVRDSAEKVRKIVRSIRIPPGLDGRLSILVSSGSSLSRYEVQVSRDKFVPQDFDHLLKIVAERRKTQNLYIQVRTMDNGLIVNGQELRDVPPSVLNVMSTRSSGGVMNRQRDRVLYEEAVPMEDVISGAKQLSLTIVSPPKATTPGTDDKRAWYGY
ncbi:hypothetical protein JW998_10345 [candidate division KSB1 bacterium]|nr:hypothetical protein [candidate division KSB1 bacterium]